MIQEIESKSILSKLRQADPYFGISYNMNIYRGCQHACIYCDTRSACYQVGDIGNISVKSNALVLLRNELRGKKQKGTIGTGSMNDPYMPVEADYGMVRKALEVIADAKFPVHVITKSDLVVRDTDLLQKISGTYAAVSFTITSASDAMGRKIEPFAPVSSARFKTMETLAQKGIYTGMTLMPLLPHVNDTVENIKDLVKMANDSRASYIISMFGVTLRKGSRDYLYQAFDRDFKGMREKYTRDFGDRYECFSPNYKKLDIAFKTAMEPTGMSSGMSFYTPEENRQLSLF